MLSFVKETVKILLGEDRKLEKMRMIMRSIADSLHGKFGKLPEFYLLVEVHPQKSTI